jgi:hypothetical protein
MWVGGRFQLARRFHVSLREVVNGAEAPCLSFVQTQHAASPKLTPGPLFASRTRRLLRREGGRTPPLAPARWRGGVTVMWVCVKLSLVLIL